MRNFELPGRSPVFATGGMAATSHPLSTETAIQVLRRGGNAMDAAIAACAVQCVVEPGSTGIGGDCFALYAPAGSSNIVAFNGSGRAPAAATPAWFAEQGIESIEQQSPHAVTVPGAVDAWASLNADHGRLDFADLLQPAVQHARNGYPVAPRTQRDWAEQEKLLSADANARTVFLPGGKAPAVGDLHVQPTLAATLERIADEGRDGFYRGPVAEDIVEYLRGLGGLHTLDDFARTAGEYVDPICTDYRGYTVWECPPNGQGIIALLILNILAGARHADEVLSPERIHLEVEATRLAYAQRDAFVADPAQARVPVEALLSDAHADELSDRIDPGRAGQPGATMLPHVHEDTVYICVVDGDGNAASFINSLFHPYGTGLLAPESGVLLHCRGLSFELDPEHPNAIAPGKRPMHTIIPGMLGESGHIRMPFGVMGGHYQALGHAQFLTRLLDYGCDLQEAMDLPRFFPLAASNRVEMEGAIPQETLQALERMGHQPVPPKRPIGGSQAIWIDHERGVLVGASDPRKDGCALGY